MTHIFDLKDATPQKPTIVTVGVFDGVHLGHQHLVKQLVKKAAEANYQSAVLTFYPHPDTVLADIDERYYITSPETRAEILLDLGVDIVVSHPFNDDVRHMRAAEFVDNLKQFLNMKAIWATANFAMGYQREGNIKFLKKEGQEKDFTVKTVDLVQTNQNGDKVSSSTIRDLIRNGNIIKANEYLGRYFQLAGNVVHGERRGRQIGFPTANVSIWKKQLLPQKGVYACWAHVDGKRYMAVTNVGQRPTFDGTHITIEAHLLDFNEDIYGRELKLDFVQQLRTEKKFDGIESLINQIKQDTEIGRDILLKSQDNEV